MLYANIRGLYLLSNKTKIRQTEDLMIIHNSVGTMITESWLSDDILDAELNIKDFSYLEVTAMTASEVDLLPILGKI